MNELKAYQCEKCKKIGLDKEIVIKCCTDKFCECGNKIEYLAYTKCQNCLEKNRFEKAEKINYSDYEVEMFYDHYSDKYFHGKNGMIDYYSDEDGEIPIYVYGCKGVDFKLNIEHALENAVDDMYEDFDDIVDEKELREFIEIWNNKQHGKSFYPDFKEVVLF